MLNQARAVDERKWLVVRAYPLEVRAVQPVLLSCAGHPDAPIGRLYDVRVAKTLCLIATCQRKQVVVHVGLYPVIGLQDRDVGAQ